MECNIQGHITVFVSTIVGSAFASSRVVERRLLSLEVSSNFFLDTDTREFFFEEGIDRAGRDVGVEGREVRALDAI